MSGVRCEQLQSATEQQTQRQQGNAQRELCRQASDINPEGAVGPTADKALQGRQITKGEEAKEQGKAKRKEENSLLEGGNEARGQKDRRQEGRARKEEGGGGGQSQTGWNGMMEGESGLNPKTEGGEVGSVEKQKEK